MKSVFKYLKKILLIIGILLATIALFLFIVGFFYGDKAKQIIVSEISKRMNVEVSVKEIDLSLFSNFPEASVAFTDLKTQDKIHPSIENLLLAKKLTLLFDIFDILTGKYKIEKVVLEETNLKLIIFYDTTNNFTIFKTPGKSEKEIVEIDLKKVFLKGVNVSYTDYSTDQEYVFSVIDGKMTGAFSSEKYLLDFEGELLTKLIRSGKTMLLKDQEILAALKISIDQKQNLYQINTARLTLAGITLDINGFIKSDIANKNLNLTIKCEKSKLQDFISLIPDKFKDGIRDYSIDGYFNLNAKIEGEFSGDNMPFIQCDFSVDKGKIVIKQSGLTLKNVSFNGAFENGPSRSKESFDLKLFGFNAGINAGQIKGELTLNNFDKPNITANLSSSLNLDKINEIIQIESLQSISGQLDFNIKFSNSLKNIHKITIHDFISSKTSGTMKITGVNLRLKDSPVNYNNLNGAFKFNNRDLLVENFSGFINESDFKMTGYFLNMMAYAFIPGEEIKIKADFSSASFNMADLLAIRKDKSGSTYRMKFSDRINYDLNLKIKKFKLGTFTGENISGNAVMKNNKLTIREASLNSMEGKTLLNGYIDGNYPDRFWISFTAGLKDVNIQQLFFQLGEFGQQNITSNQIRGKVDATIYYKSFIGSDLIIDQKSVYALGDIVINQGELIKYTPLYKLSKYVKKQELEHIRFSMLKNQIEIKDQVIYIPDMNIESSTLDLKIFGSHSFENYIDYHVRILLSELLSKRDKKKEEEIEGIFTEEDGLGQTTLFLHMTGNAENPDIKYDTKEVRKKISADMNKEKLEIKDAFKREFGGKVNEQPTGQDDPNNTQPLKGKDFKIEWEDDIPDNVKKTELPAKQKTLPEKKTGQKEFIIEWDEESDTLK